MLFGKAQHASALLLPLAFQIVYGSAIRGYSDTSLRQCLIEAAQGDGSKVQFPDEPDFLTADVRPFNLNLQYVPFAVTYPDNAQEVAEIMICASSSGRRVQARSGGRDFINKCIGGSDGHIIVDVHKLDKIEAQTHVASIGPGNLLGDLVHGLHSSNKRFIPHGSSRSVGVGGHFMVGGMGYTSREHGLAVDAIQEIEVVLANGTTVRAAGHENVDLFWAMRGAGASFGIATEFKVQTQREPAEAVGFTYTYKSEDPAVLADALKAHFKVFGNQGLSTKIGGTLRFTNTSLVFSGGFFGPKVEFDQIGLADSLPSATNASIIPNLSWIDFMDGILGSGGSTNDPAFFAIGDTVFTRPLLPTQQTLDTFLEYVYSADNGSAQWSFLLDLYGGAVGNMDSSATAFPHPDALVCLTAYARTTDATSSTTSEFLEAAILKLQGGNADRFGSYAGVPSLSLGDRAQKKYWGNNLQRLEGIKARLDPKDIFSTPQGIKPAI